MKDRKKRSAKICLNPDCGKTYMGVKFQKWCPKCYPLMHKRMTRLGRHGGRNAREYRGGFKLNLPLKERFWKKVKKGDDPSSCWLWMGSVDPRGYGFFRINGHLNAAHRIAYELANSIKIPKELLACHHCDNPPCVNPAHIFIGTHKDNTRDAMQKGRWNPRGTRNGKIINEKIL